MQDVPLHLPTFSFIPDQSLNCCTMESSDIMSSIEFVTSVECSIVGVPLTGEFEVARCDILSFIGGIEPTDKGFDHEIEQEWGEGVSLEGPSPDSHRWGMAVGCDELC